MSIGKMRTLSVVLTFGILATTLAFDCGIHLNKNEHLKSVINKCVASNKTLEDIWDMAPMSSESESSSSEEITPGINGKMNFRTRRSNSKMNEMNETHSQSEETVTESCIIQCILDNLKMTDLVGYPAHDKMIEGLLKNATSRELKDFLQSTTDDCFQIMDKEDTMDPCSYSIKLVTCMAEKGKDNCADWPVGELPLHQ